MKHCPFPLQVMLSLEYKRTMSNSTPCQPVKLRFLISTVALLSASTRSPCSLSHGCPACHPVTRKPSIVLVVIVRINATVFPTVGKGRQLHLVFRATSRFAHAATRRFARLPYGAFVRELSAQVTLYTPSSYMVNYRTP